MAEGQVLVLDAWGRLLGHLAAIMASTAGLEGGSHVLWGRVSTFLANSSWSTWPSSASGWTPTYSEAPTTSELPATSVGGPCEACCPSRPQGGRSPWTASRCLMGSHHPVTRKSEGWFLLPSRMCVWSLHGSLFTQGAWLVRLAGSTRQSQPLWRRGRRRPRSITGRESSSWGYRPKRTWRRKLTDARRSSSPMDSWSEPNKIDCKFL